MRIPAVFFILLLANVQVLGLGVSVMEKSSPCEHSQKQGGWLEERQPQSYSYTPAPRTGIIQPDSTTEWHHGETGVAVEWRGLPDGIYKIELYRNDEQITLLSTWLEGVSSFTKTTPVLTSWGSGGGYRILLTDDVGNEYWSDEFNIRSNVQVLFPDRFAGWSIGTTGTGVAWTGCQGNQVKIELHRNGSYIADYSSWIANSGYYTRNSPIPSAWGSGEGYSLLVSDNQGNSGYSSEFEIGNMPVTITGNTVRWTGGVGVVKVELYDGNRLIEDLTGWIDNSGSYTVSSADIPAGMDIGEGSCRVLVSDSRGSFGWGGRTMISMEPKEEPEPVRVVQTQHRSSSSGTSVSDYGPLVYVVVMGAALVYLLANSGDE